MAIFKARYAGKCAKCALPIAVGEFIAWSKRQRGVVYHAACVGDQSQGESQGQSQGENQGQGEPQATPQGDNVPATDTDTVRRIARDVAREEDASNLRTMLAAVEERVSKHVPRDIVVHLRTADGTKQAKVENAHHALSRLVYLISKRQHSYLFGPPGSGKSTGAVQAAKALSMRYGYVSLNPQTPESRLLGFIDAGGVYRETEFYRCYVNGGVFCIDELDNGHPALLNTLNGMLETDSDGIGRGAFPCGVVERHADFVCVATGNTNGRGADKLFPERRALDAAFMERFTFIAWGYDEAMEKAITLSINKKHGTAWLKFIRDVRAFCADNGIRLWASPRASFRGADLLRDSGWSVAEVADAVLFKGLDSDTRDRILQACRMPQFDVPQAATATE